MSIGASTLSQVGWVYSYNPFLICYILSDEKRAGGLRRIRKN